MRLNPGQTLITPCTAWQESYYELLRAGSFLSADETDVLAWGRNARVTVPPRFKASGSHAVTYKRATAVECLVRALAATPGRGEQPRPRTPLQALAEQGSARGRGRVLSTPSFSAPCRHGRGDLDVTAMWYARGCSCAARRA